MKVKLLLSRIQLRRRVLSAEYDVLRGAFAGCMQAQPGNGAILAAVLAASLLLSSAAGMPILSSPSNPTIGSLFLQSERDNIMFLRCPTSPSGGHGVTRRRPSKAAEGLSSAPQTILPTLKNRSA